MKSYNNEPVYVLVFVQFPYFFAYTSIFCLLLLRKLLILTPNHRKSHSFEISLCSFVAWNEIFLWNCKSESTFSSVHNPFVCFLNQGCVLFLALFSIEIINTGLCFCLHALQVWVRTWREPSLVRKKKSLAHQNRLFFFLKKEDVWSGSDSLTLLHQFTLRTRWEKSSSASGSRWRESGRVWADRWKTTTPFCARKTEVRAATAQQVVVVMYSF